MFIILINFILLKISSDNFCKTVAYADDTSLLFRIRPSDMVSDVRKAIANVESIVRTFERFGLVVNASTTGLTLLRHPQRTARTDPVFLCGAQVPLSSTVKCLGLTVHENLQWPFAHLKTLLPKCYAVVSAIRRLRDLDIPVEGLLLVYKMLFLPTLCYGISIWGGGYKVIIHRAEVIQNDALRAVFGRRRRDSVADVFDDYELLPVSKIYTTHVALLALLQDGYGSHPVGHCIPNHSCGQEIEPPTDHL